MHSPRPKFIISWKDLDEKMIWSWQPTISSKINGSGDLQPETQFLQFITRILMKAWYFSFFSDPFSQESHRTIYVLKLLHTSSQSASYYDSTHSCLLHLLYIKANQLWDTHSKTKSQRLTKSGQLLTRQPNHHWFLLPWGGLPVKGIIQSNIYSD